jgi:hypothetical protein
MGREQTSTCNGGGWGFLGLRVVLPLLCLVLMPLPLPYREQVGFILGGFGLVVWLVCWWRYWRRPLRRLDLAVVNLILLFALATPLVLAKSVLNWPPDPVYRVVSMVIGAIVVIFTYVGVICKFQIFRASSPSAK